MDNRFEGLSKSAIFGLLLIPLNLDKPSSNKLILRYSPDLPPASSAAQEIKLWKRHW